MGLYSGEILQVVTKNQAEKLRDIGFNLNVHEYYEDGFDVNNGIKYNLKFVDMNENDGCYSAPQIALAIKWLRDVKLISVEVKTQACQWAVSVVDLNACCNLVYEDGFRNYEEAESFGLDEALYKLLN